MLYEQFDSRVWSSEICTEDKSFHMLVVYFKRLNETRKKEKCLWLEEKQRIEPRDTTKSRS